MRTKTIAMCDGSYLAYAAASAGEKRSIVVSKRGSKWSKSFKGKTEFKKWREQYNIKKAEELEDSEEEHTPIVAQDFDVETLQMSPEDFQYSSNIISKYSEMFPEAVPLSTSELVCYRRNVIDWWENEVDISVSSQVTPVREGSISIHTAKSMLRDWKARSFADEMIISLDHGETFRHTGVTIQKYKDRAAEKALNLQIVKDWLQLESEKFGYTCEVVDTIEADDRIAMHQSKGWVEMNKKAKELYGEWYANCNPAQQENVFNHVDKYIAVTVDKDNAQVSGFWLNPFKDSQGNNVNDEPKLVSGVGGLYFKGKDDNEVGGFGFKWLCYQSIFGDKTDTFSGTKLANTLRKARGEKIIQMGAKKIKPRLDTCTTYKECLEEVINIYKELYPWEYFTYNHWKTGEKITATWRDVVQEVFMCAYMLRSEDDPTTFKSLCEKHGVENYD